MLGLATLAIVLLASFAFAISRHSPTDVSAVDASPWVVATSGPGSNSLSSTDVSAVDASPRVVATSGPGSNSWNALALRTG